jgi:PAS domain S-box-containing protein
MDPIANLSGYQIRDQLYAGLRTLVYRGIRESDGQPVVIKLLHNPLPNFSELVQFRNQYTIAKNLHLPSIDLIEQLLSESDADTEVEAAIRSLITAIAPFNQKNTSLYLQIYHQATLNLLGDSSDPSCLSGESYQVAKDIPAQVAANDRTGLFFSYVCQQQLDYLFGHYAESVEKSNAAKPYFENCVSSLPMVLHFFYDSLAQLAIYATATPPQRQQILKCIQANQKNLKKWGDYAPMNHQHKFLLVEAERYQVLGQKLEAIENYDRAIQLAKENQFLNEEALANQLAALFYLDWGKEKVAQVYMQEAYYCYVRWGAKAKIHDLETRYPQLLTAILQIPANHFSISDTRIESLDRIELIKLLCTQVAISLENARLYGCEQDKSQDLQVSLDQLEQSELRFRNLFENSPDAILLVNQARFIDCNQATLDLFGYTHKDQLLKLHPSSISPELQPDGKSSFEQANAIIVKALETGSYQFEWMHQRSNGEDFWAEVLLTMILYDGVQVLYSVVRDIGDRKQAEINLQQTNLLLQSVLEATSDMIFAKDIEHKYLFANSATLQLLGLSTEAEIVEKTDFDVLPLEFSQNIREWDERVLRSGIAEKFEEDILNSAGQTVNLYTTKTPIRDPNGNIIGTVGMTRDITDRKQAEAAVIQKSQELEQTLEELKQAQLQMVQNEKMATLGNLVAGVAHEINNPIGFITGSVNNIEEYIQDLLAHIEYYQKYYPEPVPEVRNHAEDIDVEFLVEDLPKLIPSMRIASQRIREISNSLRTFSRADTAEKVACDIHEGINSTLLILKYRLKASEKRPAIEVISEYGKLPLIKCFLGQLNQVFMNIIANAIDAFDTASLGQTFAEIEANPQLLTICTEVSGDRKMAVIQIRDNGPGMSEDVRSHIFEHLFTTKDVGKGTGLGLAIARQIVEEKHGGKLSCISAPGRGTEFVIEILIE